MKKKITLGLITVILTILAFTGLIISITPASSYSGSYYFLKEHGTVTKKQDTLYYKSNVQLLTTMETRCLSKLKKQYTVKIINDE